MDRKKLQSLFSEIDSTLIGSFCDDIELCQQIDYPVYTKYFYPPQFWSRLNSINEGVEFETIGLNDSCEKRMIGVIPKDFDREFLEFPVKYFKIINSSKFKELEHKHFLGTIMSLGIKREILGDLTVKNGVCYGIINEELFDFLVDNLKEIGKTPVKIEEIKFQEIPKSEFIDIVESVASMRFDVIVSALGNFSRNDGSEKIEAGEVLLNYGVEKEKSRVIKEKDIISIRKKGKFIIQSILGETKKGKTRILAKKFS